MFDATLSIAINSRAAAPSHRAGRLALVIALACVAPAAIAATPDVAPTANLQYDWAHVDSDRAALRHDHGTRRARLGFKVKDADGRWQFVAEHDFADNTPADAYLELTPAKGHALRVGQFKQPFLLEDAVSDKNAPLLESSLIGAFAISRRLGVEYARFNERGSINAALFGQRLDGTNESTGAALRGVRVLHQDAGGLLHVGASVASESSDTGRASFSGSLGSTLVPARLGSASSTGVERIDRGAVEALWMRNAWSMQAEAGHAGVERDGRGFDGHAESLLVTWSPSGDARSYKRGVVGAPATKDGPAWELAARWSALTLDGSPSDARMQNLGLAATCYVNAHLRIATNVVRSVRAGVSDRPVVAGLRIQLTY